LSCKVISKHRNGIWYVLVFSTVRKPLIYDAQENQAIAVDLVEEVEAADGVVDGEHQGVVEVEVEGVVVVRQYVNLLSFMPF
jgi:hypothetical protein